MENLISFSFLYILSRPSKLAGTGLGSEGGKIQNHQPVIFKFWDASEFPGEMIENMII